MSHHGINPLDKNVKQENILEELFESVEQGETSMEYLKQYPAGKLNKDDEGIIAFRITNKDDKIIIDFGKSIYWLGLEIKEAKGLRDLLNKHIEEVE